MELSERRLKILSTLIDAYIESREPVGSKAIVFDKFNLSSATLRNEMARLEEMGLVYQPYTSAGRVPSNLGYQYYVDVIMDELYPNPARMRRIDLMAQTFSSRPDRLLSQCAYMAAALTNCAAISIQSIEQDRKIIYFECSTIDRRNVAVIAVIGTDSIKTSVYATEEDVNVNDMTVLNRLLNVHMTGVEISKMTDRIFETVEMEIVRYVPSMRGISRVIKSIIEDLNDVEMIVCGESNLLQYPEFYDIENLKQFYSIIADRHSLNKMISSPQGDQLNVRIDPDFFPNTALITAPIPQKGGGKATLSVVGPTRMNYPRVISDMKYLSYLISKLMLGEDEQSKLNTQNKGET